MTATIEQLRDLAERLGKATGPDRELDALVASAVGWKPDDEPDSKFIAPVTCEPDFPDGAVSGYVNGQKVWKRAAPLLTASIDASLAMVERKGIPVSEVLRTAIDEAIRANFGIPGWRLKADDLPIPILRALVAALISQAEGGAQ